MLNLPSILKALLALLILISWAESAQAGVISSQLPSRTLSVEVAVASPSGDYQLPVEDFELQIGQVELLISSGPLGVLSNAVVLGSETLSCDRIIGETESSFSPHPLEILRPS